MSSQRLTWKRQKDREIFSKGNKVFFIFFLYKLRISKFFLSQVLFLFLKEFLFVVLFGFCFVFLFWFFPCYVYFDFDFKQGWLYPGFIPSFEPFARNTKGMGELYVSLFEKEGFFFLDLKKFFWIFFFSVSVEWVWKIYFPFFWKCSFDSRDESSRDLFGIRLKLASKLKRKFEALQSTQEVQEKDANGKGIQKLKRIPLALKKRIRVPEIHLGFCPVSRTYGNHVRISYLDPDLKIQDFQSHFEPVLVFRFYFSFTIKTCNINVNFDWEQAGHNSFLFAFINTGSMK